EIGTPFCATIDHTTLADDTVTLRERDSTGQVRLPGGGLPEVLRDLLDGRVRFADLGTPVTRP
ncbi:MAG TPA: His/Gly/Thr/Pro-type tRNA ligase C-terminal domain-containing protein, partial [Thermoplasmata archaeon]|nr:His/Gly/Thr/Pro-type tRNA ligase C-terminal domain-containing protein [Thermoplasmata archaeon]